MIVSHLKLCQRGRRRPCFVPIWRTLRVDSQSYYEALALKANHVTPEDVYAVLIGMFGCGDVLPKTNLEAMFTAATTRRFWDYTHHSPVEKLLRRFLPDHLSLTREYKAHLSGFYATTKLIDYITYTNIDSAEDNTLDLLRLTDANCQKLKVKLELDRKIDTISLKYVQDLWEEFAEEFDIPYLTAVIGKILSGSLHVTWLITSDMVNKIATAAHKSSFFQNHPNIIYVAINDTVHYDEVARCEASFKESLGKGIEDIDLHVPDDQRLVNFIDQNVKFDRIKRLDLAANKRTYTVTVNSKAQFCNITGYKPCHRAVVDDVKRNFITGLFYTLFVSGFVVGLIVGVFAGSTAADQMFYSSLAGAIAGAIAAPIQSAIIHIDDEEDPVFDIDSVRLFAMRLLAIILGSALIGASGNASAGAAMVAIGVAFVGSLVAGVLSRKPIKSITNAIIFSVSFGALVGTAIRTVGGTIPGAISGAITAGVVAMTFDTLKTIFRTVIATGTFSEMVKIVAGVIKTIPREDKRAVIIGTVIGAILNTFVGKGALFGAVAGALYATRYVTLPNITDLIKIFYSIMLSLFALCIEVTYVALGVGAAGTVGGLIVIVLISTSLIIHPPGNPIFDPFRYKPVFAAVAGICAGVATVILIFTDRVDFPQPLGRSVTAAVIGAAAVGFLLAAVVNGIRRVDRAITTFNDRSIAAIRIDVARGILRRIDIAIIQAAIGAVCGTMFGYVLELIAGDKLAGDKLAEITMGAILGTITGIASGSITAIAVATIKNVTVPAITKMCTVQRIIVVTTIGAFIGGIFGGYFVSNIVAGFLIALSFSVVTTVIYTAHLYEERRRWFKRVNQIPLVSVMNTFGIELRYLTNEEAQNNWLLYKIAKAP